MKPVRVLVDLTPLGRGGANGGAKVVAVELVRHLAATRPGARLTLLTSSGGHEELESLEGLGNVERRLAVPGKPLPAALKASCPPESLSCEPSQPSRFILPGAVRAHAFALAQRLRARLRGLAREIQADLLFCPFGTPFYHRPGRPTISLVHDLQFQAMPRYFTSYDRHLRSRHFALTAKLATHIVCISDFVRRSVIEATGRPDGQVSTIHHAMASRLPDQSPERQTEALRGLGLGGTPYLLYPANFWPHKNHAMLLVAFGMLRATRPGLAVELVLTGHPDQGMEDLRQAAQAMGLERAVRFCGYLGESELAALFRQATGMVFPSLYEGFGLPVLEAMALGAPVACANTTSLPEVAGDAALAFDPRRPEELAQAMARLLEDGSLRASLREKGLAQAAAFSDGEAWAGRYWDAFDRVVAACGGKPCA